MEVTKISEYGAEEATYGLSLSYNLSDNWDDFYTRWSTEKDFLSRMSRVKDKLYSRDNGENKFLESMVVYLDINMPRYWWQQFDTYRVGMTKQSKSTMHTIMRRPLMMSDFIRNIDPVVLYQLNAYIQIGEFDNVKTNLPEGFLQRREVCTNYKVLRHICQQRHLHRLPEWHFFVDSILDQLDYPMFMGLEKNYDEQKEG